MHRRWLLALTALALMPAVVSLAQEARTDAGLLICGPATSDEADDAGDAATMPQLRRMLCTFRPTNGGPEETYVGAYESVGEDSRPSGGHAMIWIVKMTPTTRSSAGLLQQAYAADRGAPPRHLPPLIGETDSSIVLLPMADTQEQSSKDERPIAGTIIVSIALKLASSPA